MSEVERQIAEPGRRVGVSTGLADFDAATGGLLPGQLIVLAARPSMGKSRSPPNGLRLRPGVVGLCCSARSKCRPGNQAADAVFRFRGVDVSRSLRQGERIDLSLLRQSAEVLSSLPLSIEDKPASRSRVHHLGGPPGAIATWFIWFGRRRLSATNFPDDDRLRRDEQVGRMTRQLKDRAARVLGCPVVVLGRNFRIGRSKGKGNRPALSHLRESGAIEQDADCVVCSSTARNTTGPVPRRCARAGRVDYRQTTQRALYVGPGRVASRIAHVL